MSIDKVENREPYMDEGEKPSYTLEDVAIPEYDEEDQDQQMPRSKKGKATNCIQRAFDTVVPPGGLLASSITLCSSTLGSGILGLPAAFNRMGIATALIILIICVLLTIFSLYILAIAAEKTGIHNYPGIVDALLGKGAAIFMAIVLILNCIGGGVSYIVTCGHIFEQILDDDEVPAYLRTTSGNRVMVTAVWLVFMMPLCIWKRIDTLRYFSIIGVAFVLYFVICLVVDSGRYLNKNGWRKDIRWTETGNGVCVTLGTIVFACQVQMNAFEIYHECDKPSARRMFRNASFAMGLCGILYIVTAIMGYARFGPALTDSVLLQYQPRVNKEMWVAYFGLIFKLCVAYVMHQFPMRDSLYYFLGWDVHFVNWWLNAGICIVLASINLILGLFVPKLNAVLGLTGSLCGSFTAFIIPAFLYMYMGNWTLKTIPFYWYFINWFLLLVGGIALTWGTIGSLYDIGVNGI